jgi:tetratricopeptide (TPR) repeat protein
MDPAHPIHLSCYHKHPTILAGGTFMFRKYFSLTLVAAALLSLSAVAAMAQNGQLRGHVKFKQADGTVVPAVGAIVDVVRLDVTGKYEGKTDKRGEFVWAGLPYIGDYIIGVSMANAQPSYQGGVKVGRDVDYEIEMTPGDGHRLSIDELKQFAHGGGGSASGPAKSGGESAADKAKREELIKKNAEIAEKNKKNSEVNEVLARTFKAGQDAIVAKNYDEAIKQFDEGIAADPEQAVLYTRKADALRMRGVDRYNQSIRAKEPAVKTSELDLAKADFKQSAEVATLAVDLAKKEPAVTDPAGQASQNGRRLAALLSRAESMRLYVSKGDQTQAESGIAAYQEYLAAETDATRKAKAERDEAQMLFDASVFDKALVAYQKLIEVNPDDLDALLKTGLILFNIGAMNTDKAKYQEAANYLQKYVDKAPDSDSNKADAKAIIENLKDQENVKPEKITTRPARRRP